MAPYQSFKLLLVEAVGLSKNGFHFFLGALAYLMTVAIFKIKFTSAKSLIAPIVLALLMEIMDFRDATAFDMKLDWADSLKDVLLTVSSPLIIWASLNLRNKF